ncbi:MAG: PspC domain-containing protein [Marinilabiliaceae bacterium]|jgi:phage shock protein PspC (stress-responsive transcriptional regulator)|nr:PspC domain-containing protein [Marinilabiliaceae bacterium]
MKITVSINIGGIAFHIDEDAYTELKIYLRSLERHFAKEESSSEIMADIEARIGELLKARISDYKQVVTLQDVLEVISILGTPEDIGEEDNGRVYDKISSPKYSRMYRDPDNRIIGGVSSGMAAYWGIDPWIVRVVFIVLALPGGLGILIYAVLWIVLPEAKTTAQKIEMKGEKVNIHNIKNSVKDEFENVKKNMNL